MTSVHIRRIPVAYSKSEANNARSTNVYENFLWEVPSKLIRGGSASGGSRESVGNVRRKDGPGLTTNENQRRGMDRHIVGNGTINGGGLENV